MADQQPSPSSLLLNRYRNDRRKLLEFVLSSCPSAATTSSLSGVDFDTLSADYVLDCLSSGGVVDVAEASKKYLDELAYPTMIHSQSGDSFYLCSDQEWAGSPPQHPPPPIVVKTTVGRGPRSSREMDSTSVNDTETADHYGLKPRVTLVNKSKTAQSVKIPPLGLPNLHTGLSDDDLRESAYEILLASIASSGVDIYLVEEKKKEKNSKFSLGLKSKKDKTQPQSHSLDRHSQLIRTIREQMQISEAMDVCIRRRLQLPARRTQSKMDIPQISLGLLNSIFKSDFPHEKSYIQWKTRQVSVLEELLQYSANLAAQDHQTIKSSLAKIRNTQEWDNTLSPSERVEVISNIKHVALNLSSLPGQIGIKSETYYWTSAYHLNIRLYEKLLFSVFDILDEGELIEEADEILALIKSTWSTFGVTQKIHDAIFGWVIFQQFVGTDEAKLLENATLQLQKLVSIEDEDKERIYIDSLSCLKQFGRNKVKLSLIDAVFFSISNWCSDNLQDYHLHFSKQPGTFKSVMTLLSTVGIPISDDNGAIKMQLRSLSISDRKSSKTIQSYVERAIENAYKRVVRTIDLESKIERKHPLCLLANELRLIVERESKVFYPVLRDWCPKAGAIIAMQLHHIFGEKLKIFLKQVKCLDENFKSVLPAAYLLDHDLTILYTTSYGGNNQDLPHYPIGEVSKPIILDWIIAQHSRILEWTGRAFDFEGWEPLSSQQRQAASIVEVFRIIEETVDQLFGLKLPMDITHLQALLSIIFHTLDAYLVKLLDQLVEKNHLYPSAPPLTRYKEGSMTIMKKKVLEDVILDDSVIKKLNHLTVSKLCVRLNTLKYIQKQIDGLEEGIRKSWTLVGKSDKNLSAGEAIDELFSTTFDIIRDASFSGISKLCDFIGPRVVFWDLRDAFICGLYRGTVEDARLDNVLPHFDTVLDKVCGLIDDALRDRVISSICRASLEGFAWVLLDGGPSRAFSDSDIVLMEDDLTTLKEFFIANGDGLPTSLVEQEAKFSEKVLELYSLETESVIQMLMTASAHISLGLDSCDNDDQTHVLNIHTLMRVLCHKKDSEASRFLKTQYQLPMSSEYEDSLSKDLTSIDVISNLWQRSASFHWNNNSKNSHGNFSLLKQKFQEATSRSFRM